MGTKRDRTMVMDSKTELTTTKVTEMITESIPGSVLRKRAAPTVPFLTYLTHRTESYAYIRLLEAGGQGQTQALLSIIISAITTGFSSASISCECAFVG